MTKGVAAVINLKNKIGRSSPSGDFCSPQLLKHGWLGYWLGYIPSPVAVDDVA